MRTLVLLFILLTLSQQGLAQLKYEKETRVRKNAVPVGATTFVERLDFDSRVKWFKETKLNSISFEAKTKYRGKSYSIEFSEGGAFEDVEITVTQQEVPAETLTVILDHLSEQHQKFSVEKIQLQYSGDADLIFDFFKNQGPDEKLVVNYEWVISTKVEGSYAMLEYLFSNKGDFIEKSLIVLNRTDNIEF